MKPFFAAAGLSLLLTAGLSCSSDADCAKVSLDACGHTFGCQALSAEPVQTSRDPSTTCSLPEQVVSCERQRACTNPSPSVAKDPAGKEWVLHSPCVPTGWTQTSTSATIASCPICALLSLADCASGGHCQAIQGRPVDKGRSCVGPFEAIGCRDRLANCGGIPTRHVDLAAREWIMGDNCAPLGWSDSASSDISLGLCTSLGDGGADGDAPVNEDAGATE